MGRHVGTLNANTIEYKSFEDIKHIIRGDIKQWNQMLAEAAHNAGV